MKFVTTPQAADRLGVTEQRVRQFISEGRLPATKMGNTWVIVSTELTKFARKHERSKR